MLLQELTDFHTASSYGLKLANIDLNRKVLSEMAVNDAEGFAKLAEVAKSKLA